MEIMTQTLQVVNPNDMNTHIIRNTQQKYYHTLKKKDGFSNCSNCFFWIPGKYISCARDQYIPKLPCTIYKKVDIQEVFVDLVLSLAEEHKLTVFTRVVEVSSQLYDNPRSLYIQIYNQLITKKLLQTLLFPCKEYGYGLTLSVNNDELTIYYYKDDETGIESDE